MAAGLTGLGLHIRRSSSFLLLSSNNLAVSPTRRLSRAFSLAAAAGVVLFRLLGTRTTACSQHFDVSAVHSGLALPKHAAKSSDAVLTAISLVSFVLIGGLLVGASLLRRRFDLVAAVAVTLIGAFGTTEVLKSSLPHRAGIPGHLGRGFPSGRPTVALALGLSFILVALGRRKWVVAAAAALYAAAMGATLVFYAWHFPSDVVVASGSRPRGLPARHSSRHDRSSAAFRVVLVGAAFVLVVAAALAAL